MSSCTVINAHITDQVIQLSNLPRIASGLVGALQFRCNFCGKWDGCGKVAVFYRTEDEVYHVPVESGLVTVPPEVLADEGHFYMGFAGVDDLTRTTEVIRIEVAKGAITQATAVSDPTPDIYHQLMAIYTRMESQFTEAIAMHPGDGTTVYTFDDPNLDTNVWFAGTIKSNGASAYVDLQIRGYDGSYFDDKSMYYSGYIIPPWLAPLGVGLFVLDVVTGGDPNFVVDIDFETPNEDGWLRFYFYRKNGDDTVYESLGVWVSITYPLANISIPELANARIDFTGTTTYPTVGEAVREQVLNLHNRCGYLDGRVNGVEADIADLKENGIADPITIEDDGAGHVKITKAKAPEEPDEPVEPDTPVEPEPEPVQHTLSGPVVTIDDVDAVGLPLEITPSGTAAKVHVITSQNLLPDTDKNGVTIANGDGGIVVDSTTKQNGIHRNILFDRTYPAGDYRVTAKVDVTNAGSEGALPTKATIRFFNGATYVGFCDITVNDGVTHSVAVTPHKSGGVTLDLTFNEVRLYAGHYSSSDKGFDALWSNLMISCNTGAAPVYEPYEGESYGTPIPELTLESVPTLILSDDQSEMVVNYYTPPVIDEPDEPVEPDTPVEPEPEPDEPTGEGVEMECLETYTVKYTSFPDKEARADIKVAQRAIEELQELIAQGGGDTPSVDTPLPPDYYFANDYLPNKVQTINDRMQNSAVNGDAFIFITDMHTERGNANGGKAPSLIRYINDHTKVRRMFLGGDLAISLPQHTAVSESLANAFDGDIHYAMGNHEYDTYSASGVITPRMTEADLFYTYDINKQEQVGNPGRHYYYVDNPQQKMRYVVVNNWMHNPSDETYSDGIKASDLDVQAAWLTNTAFDVAEGWGIVVFCHQFYNGPDATAPSGTATAFLNAIDTYDGNGEIIAVFHGHIHRDLLNRTASGVPVIGVTADKTDTSVESVVLSERTKGTITEQAFDVVVIDRNARKLHCIRIGAPAIGGNGAEGNPQVETRVVDFRVTN